MVFIKLNIDIVNTDINNFRYLEKGECIFTIFIYFVYESFKAENLGASPIKHVVFVDFQ